MTNSDNGKAYYSNGTLAYEGGIISNLPSGKGKLYTIEGKLLYDGHFKAGKLQGKGELYDNETGDLSMQGTFDAVIDNLDNSDVKKIKFIGNFKGTSFTGSNKTKSFEGTLTGDFDSYGGNVKIKGKYYNTGDNDITDISLLSNNYQNLEFSGQVYENGKLMLDGSMKGTETKIKKSYTVTGKMYLTQKDLDGDDNSKSDIDKEEISNFNGQLYVDGKKFLDGNMTINKPKGSTESKTAFMGSFYQNGKLIFKGKLDDSGMTGACKLYYSNGKR
jgi:antitoxin component YwqK of YwqJK toxin-antitoxin module